MDTTVSYEHGPQVSDGRFLYSFYLSIGGYWYVDIFRLVSISSGNSAATWDPARLDYVRTGQQR